MNTLKRLCIKRGGDLVIVPRTWEPGKLGTWETGNLGNWEPGNPGTREPGNPGTKKEIHIKPSI